MRPPHGISVKNPHNAFAQLRAAKQAGVLYYGASSVGFIFQIGLIFALHGQMIEPSTLEQRLLGGPDVLPLAGPDM